MTRANSRLPVLSAEVKLAIFFGGTFVWTWVFYLPIALGGHSPYEMPWLGLLIFGGAGPSIVGIVMVLGTWPRSLWPEFLARCFALVRIDRVSWAVVALLVPSIYAVAIWLGTAFGVPLPGAAKAEALYGQPWLWLPALFVSFMSGPWSEEFGWRGFALDLLLERSGLLVGSIGLGIVWSLWHLPLYFMPGTWHHASGLGLGGLGSFTLGNVGLSLIISWVYLRSRRSVLSAMLVHFAVNFASQLLASTPTATEALVSAGLFATGLGLCMFWPLPPTGAGSGAMAPTRPPD